MKRIGERIKKKRELLKMQLNELAEKVGVSSSALSQIEKAKSFPSIVTLKSIAENLHTTVGDLIGENESLENNPVVYKNDMALVEHTSSGTKFFLLSQHDINKQMDTYLIRFIKDSELDNFFVNSVGQIFCHILSGEVRFDLEGKSYILKSGDNIYFNAKAAYNLINTHTTVSEVIWVQSPPHF
jgi:transcriptional regulator with XRE-family HTH domain